MADNIFDYLRQLIQTIESEVITNKDELENFRIKYLGSKNIIRPLFGKIREVPNEKKKDFGILINEVKSIAQERWENTKNSLEEKLNDSSLLEMDLSRPGYPTDVGSRHPVSVVMNQIVDVFSRIGFVVEEDREIEDDWHNFTAMNTPDDHPARDMQDTFYLENSKTYLLRTHTSSVQSRVMSQGSLPIRIIAPGRVYRNETVSARSHCQFHQVEGLYIDKNVSFADMKQTLLYFAKEIYGAKTKIRLRPSYFPFTEPSAEMDVWMGTETEKARKLTKGTGWLEVLGCGLVDPNVLENCGIDSTIYSGFAFGIGIERSAMQKYDIGDIRMLFENDIRFLEQFKSAM